VPTHPLESSCNRFDGQPAPYEGSAKPPANPNEADGHGQLMKALGTTDRDFVNGLFGQLLSASARGADRFDRDWLFSTLALLKNAKPGDELDAMQVAQMAAVQAAMMRLSGDAARAVYLPNERANALDSQMGG
jgi:hypothetical protein